MRTSRCPGCGAEFPDIEGPTHRYMISSPGCWGAYGEVLAREYGDPAYFAVHRLTVDAYAVQHPGSTDRQSVQSVGVHLVRLCLVFEHGLRPEQANRAMLEAGRSKHLFTWLEPPDSPGPTTVADVVSATNVERHRELVRTWARHAWEAWSVHHPKIRAWLPEVRDRRVDGAAPEPG